MKTLGLATAALLSVSLVQSAALADGTIAIAHPADDNGWAIGVSYDSDSRADADASALAECETQRASSQLDADCRIVSRFDDQCMALAKDTGDSGTAWGWGVADAQDDADGTAMTNCRSYARARANYCAVTMRYCDGGDK